MSASAMVTWKSFNGKFTWFSNRAFYVTIPDANLESLNPLHTLCNKYLDHILVKFKQNCMGQITQNFELFDKKNG